VVSTKDPAVQMYNNIKFSVNISGHVYLTSLHVLLLLVALTKDSGSNVLLVSCLTIASVMYLFLVLSHCMMDCCDRSLLIIVVLDRVLLDLYVAC
jgi:hypothetical protein